MVEHFRWAILLGTISIIASIAVLGSVLYWLSGMLEKEAAAVAADRSVVLNNSRMIESLAAIKSNAQEVEKYSRAFDALLTTKDGLVNFSSWLDGLSRAHQVSENFSFQGNVVQSSGNSAGYTGFDLKARGAYDNLIDFLKDVEFKAPQYLVSFDDFDLSRNADAYNVVVHGRIFFR